ncbi:MAG TPA: Rieske (2Fe-2S) protein [Holophagaceae bacterium]|nr:Rieske (2Fe-2S) protein [Holophagaceae bacterium]
MSDPKPEETLHSGRRGFCKLAGSTLALFTLSRVTASAAHAPMEDGGPKAVPETKTDLAPGQVKDYRKLGNFFLLADAKGVYAVSSICTHAGCSVRSAGTGFECPCHGSAFDLLGAVTQGPAKLPLKHFEVRESAPGGPLVVDVAKTVGPDARL